MAPPSQSCWTSTPSLRTGHKHPAGLLTPWKPLLHHPPLRQTDNPSSTHKQTTEQFFSPRALDRLQKAKQYPPLPRPLSPPLHKHTCTQTNKQLSYPKYTSTQHNSFCFRCFTATYTEQKYTGNTFVFASIHHELNSKTFSLFTNLSNSVLVNNIIHPPHGCGMSIC